MRKKLGEQFEAHTSQPLGIPLHKYEGKLSLENERISFVGKSKELNEELRLLVPFKSILDVSLGWDDVQRRWKDTRALIRPLRITFEYQGRKTLYIYAKKVGARIYGKENKTLTENLKASIGGIGD